MPTKPAFTSFKDLTTICDEFDEATLKFRRTTFSYLDEDDVVWHGYSLKPKKEVTIEDVNASLEAQPDCSIYPHVEPAILLYDKNPSNVELFIKRPKLTHLELDEGPSLLPLLMLKEVQIYEALSLRPHPNIVRYHGCLHRRGVLTGIVLQLHPMTLETRVLQGPDTLDKVATLDGITRAVKHLHGLGLAHNDLNPRNVVVDEHDTPILIDFGSCAKFGEELLSAGTPGWIEEDYFTSAAETDLKALQMLGTWLDKNCR